MDDLAEQDTETAPDPLTGDASKSRIFAASVDNLCAMFLASLVMSRLGVYVGWQGAVVLYLAYFGVQEGLFSSTLGKRVFGLRVAQVDGKPCGWSGALVRTITRVVEVNPVLLGAVPGGLAVAFTKRHQRFGDMLSGCVVVKRRS